MYDLSTSRKTQITTNAASQRNSDIFKDKIVWEDGRNLNGDIYMYDLSTSTETQITNNGQSHYPSIYNDRIVWYDYRNGNMDVYMFTLAPTSELTPLIRINDLKDYVKNNVSCNPWTKKALIKPLDQSIFFLEKGKDSKAVVSLKSFIDLVKDLKRHKKISASEGDSMITEARGLINQIKAQ
jgi:beta propeller repeat protein